jgi:hypothetical protein
MDKRRLTPRRSGARDVSGAMRPQFGGNGVFPRSIWALFGRIRIVNSECRYSRAAKILPAGVVAIG